MTSFAASNGALQSLSREQHWWLQVGSTAEDRELWGWTRTLWPHSAEDLALVDACILLRPLMSNAVSCVDVASMYFLHAQRGVVTTQSLPAMLDEALEQQVLLGDADSATRAMAVHALLQLEPARLPQPPPAGVTLPPPALDYFDFLGELYSPDAITVLRLHEGRLSAAVKGLALPADMPVFRWEVLMDDDRGGPAGPGGGAARAVGGAADSGRESPAGFSPVESAMRRLRIRSGSVDDGAPVWDEADCVPDGRLEWRSAVALFRALGLVDVLPLSVVRAVAKEVVVHAQAHWLALALVERGATLAEALRATREVQTLVRRRRAAGGSGKSGGAPPPSPSAVLRGGARRVDRCAQRLRRALDDRGQQPQGRPAHPRRRCGRRRRDCAPGEPAPRRDGAVGGRGSAPCTSPAVRGSGARPRCPRWRAWGDCASAHGARAGATRALAARPRLVPQLCRLPPPESKGRGRLQPQGGCLLVRAALADVPLWRRRRAPRDARRAAVVRCVCGGRRAPHACGPQRQR